jgi:hypothetical protein
MLKRSGANYSLWPEQARPRRGLSLTLAAGGFAIGLVCAIAANNVLSNFLHPATAASEPPAKSAPVQKSASIGNIPVYTASPAPAAGKSAAAPAEPASRNQIRPTTSKVTLPMIGTQASAPAAETDGRGGETTGASVAGLAAKTDPQPNLIREAAKPAGDEPAPQASSPADTKPVAEPERAAKPRKKVVRKKRERYREYQQPSYAAQYRTGPVYGAWGQPVYGRFPY